MTQEDGSQDAAKASSETKDQQKSAAPTPMYRQAHAGAAPDDSDLIAKFGFAKGDRVWISELGAEEMWAVTKADDEGLVPGFEFDSAIGG